VLELTPTKFLTQNEIDAAKAVQVKELNVQNQQKLEWPSSLTVAKAYVDQLERSQALPAKEISALRKGIKDAEKSHLKTKQVTKLQGMTETLEHDASSAKTSADASRMQSLAAILKHPVA
jgi:hypothetical protein